MSLAYWTHNLSPFVIRFGENMGIRWYGVGYVAGFVCAGWLFRRYYRAGRTPLDPNASFDLMTALVLGVLLGGRLGYFILYQPGTLLHEPLALLRVWDGGMASHGGFAGVAIALIWFARSRKLDYRHLGDLVVTAAPPGLFLVRIANFINGELWGKVTQVPWAMIFPASPYPLMPRHPSQLYEAALEGLLLFAYTQWRFWKSDVATKRPGQIAGEFLIGYAIVRAVCEVFREPDAGIDLILGLSLGTFYSIFLVAGGAVLIALAGRKSSELEA